MSRAANPGPRFVARVPMMAAATAFAAGIVAEQYIFHPIWFWMAAAILLGAAALYLHSRMQYLAYATALVAFACVGAFTSQAAASRPSPPATILNYANGELVTIRGTVMRDGILRTGAFGSPDESVDIAVEKVSTDAGDFPASGGVRLSVFVPTKSRGWENDSDEEASNESSSLPIYRYGDRLQVTAKLRIPLNYRNPGSFDYVRYLDGLGLQAIGSAKLETLRVLEGRGGSTFERWRWSSRRKVITQIHRVWTQEQAGMFDAMVLGDRAFLSKGTRTEFQRSGTYHILVVSGMNVGIFAVALFWILRRMRAGVEVATVLTILLSCSYALLTDLGAPIVRSLLMLAVYQLTRLFYRDREALNAVGVAALALLVWEPRQVFEASFQLTVLSVIAIAGICVPLIERTSEPYRAALKRLYIKGYDQAFEPKITQWRIELRMIAERMQRLVGNKLGAWITTAVPTLALSIYELVVVSATMQVALALPMVWYFHRLPWRSLWANLAVVPLTGVLMPACVVAVACSFASLTFAKIPALIASYSLVGITSTVHFFGAAGAHDLRLAKPETLTVFLCGVAIVLAILMARRHRLLVALGLVTLCASTAWIANPRPSETPKGGVLEITAIDVGQGESLLIITPEGKSLLLDSGGLLGFSRSEFDIGEEVTSSYLWNRGIDHLDAVAFSHAHSDHLQGMRAIIANFRPQELWMGADANNALTHGVEQACDEYGVTVRRHFMGDEFEFGGAKFEVLAPERDLEINSHDLDDSSMVIRASFGDNAIILPGDAHKKVEEQLTSKSISADVLKVGHHGSATSTSAEFLTAVHPRFALISSGRNNQFRHPRPEVLKRLADARVRTYRTDLFGPVTFYLDGKTVTPSVPR
jgi:competence protein ComEC